MGSHTRITEGTIRLYKTYDYGHGFSYAEHACYAVAITRRIKDTPATGAVELAYAQSGKIAQPRGCYTLYHCRGSTSRARK